MNVFIPEELIKQVQLLLSDIVKKELNKFVDTNESTHHF